MEWIDLAWAVATSATTLAIGAFLGTTVFKALIEKSVQSKFDKKLETLKSQFRKDEEEFKQRIRTQDDNISALRSGALTNMAARDALIEKRRIEAIEAVWKATIEKHQQRTAARFATGLHMDKLLEAAGKQDQKAKNIQQYAAVLIEMAGLETKPTSPFPNTHRPFLSPTSWALYYAHASVLGYIAAQFFAIKTGVGASIIADPKAVVDLVKIALPHQADGIDKHGSGLIAYLIDELEEKLLGSLMRDLRDPDMSLQSIAEAQKILRAAEKAAASTAPPPPTAPAI